MSSILHNATLPDVTTFAANLVVFLAAVAAVIVGSMSAVKKIKESINEAMVPAERKTTTTSAQIIGGILQDQYGSAMMAEALRDNTESNNELRNAVCSLRDEMRETRHEMQLRRR